MSGPFVGPHAAQLPVPSYLIPIDLSDPIHHPPPNPLQLNTSSTSPSPTHHHHHHRPPPPPPPPTPPHPRSQPSTPPPTTPPPTTQQPNNPLLTSLTCLTPVPPYLSDLPYFLISLLTYLLTYLARRPSCRVAAARASQGWGCATQGEAGHTSAFPTSPPSTAFASGTCHCGR